MSGGVRAGAGRKATPIDLNVLEKLCSLQCSDQEIADWFGVSLRTIQNRRAQPKFGAVMRRGKAKGIINVRRGQMKLVDEGNVPMTIWLGKNLLGQRDTTCPAGHDICRPQQGGPMVISLADVIRERRGKREAAERREDCPA